MARPPASIKRAHQLLQPTAGLADMLAVPPLSKVLDAVATVREAKLRQQRKNRKAQAARAQRAARGEVCA